MSNIANADVLYEYDLLVNRLIHMDPILQNLWKTYDDVMKHAFITKMWVDQTKGFPELSKIQYDDESEKRLAEIQRIKMERLEQIHQKVYEHYKKKGRL